MSAISNALVSGYGPIASVKSEAAAAQETASIRSVQSAQGNSPAVRYSNLRIFVDPLANQVVLERRDPVTGSALNQAPTPQQLRAYLLQQKLLHPETAQSANPIEQAAASEKSTVSEQA